MRLTSSLTGVVVSASLFLIGASAPPSDRIAGVNQSSNTNAVPNRRVHTVGDLWMSIGSNGLLGTYADANGAEPDSTSRIPVSVEFPGGSRREHLFGSGLWIGGLVGGVDTVVIAAMFANSYSNPVFTPTQPMQTFYNPELGHQYFIAHYADTAMNSERYPTDRSLGVEVRQTSHAFKSRPYDRFVLVEYLIRNISRQTIYKAYAGFFADPDVFHELRYGQPESGPQDDLTGYVRERGIAYTIDNDGDAANVSDSLFSRNWCPSSFGLAPVMMDPLPACTSFNWLVTSGVDWGPSRVPSPFGHVEDPALPYGMNGMYRTMANSEIDYDQVDAAIDRTSSGWRKPAIAHAADIANGLDTRWVLSYSFGNLAPYDSLRIVMAYVIGDSIHTALGRYPDPYNPDTFAAGLDFTDLRRNVDLARWAWGHEFNLGGAAPPEVTLTAVDDTSVRISWTEAPFRPVTGYSVLRKLAGTTDGWETIGNTGADQLEWLDRSLLPGNTYEFSIASLDWNGLFDASSRPKSISMGFPPVPVVNARNEHGVIELKWSAPEQPPEFAPLTFLTIYRGTPGTTLSPYLQIPILAGTDGASGSAVLIVDPAHAPPWRGLAREPSHTIVDDSVTQAVRYEYRAQLTNVLGLKSAISGRTSAIPMNQNRRGLILVGETHPSLLLDETAQLTFYGQWAMRIGFDTATNSLSPYLQYRDSALSLKHFSRYECIIVVSEDPYESRLVPPTVENLAEFSLNGGKCIFAMRNHAYREFWDISYRPAPLIRFLTGVTSIIREGFWSPGKVLRAEFLGATPFNREYPAVDGDSARGWDFKILDSLAGTVESVYAAGYTPAVGAFRSLEPDVDVLYTYNSADQSSPLHGKPIAVRRITDSSAAILFNFPLSLMKHEQAWQALTQAVADLGIDTVNYWLPPTSTTRSMIEWLYGKSAGAPDPAWDVNHDGVIDIRDVVEELDR